MWWGYSPPLDLQSELQSLTNINKSTDAAKPIEFLIVGAADVRHVVKTLASCFMHPKRDIICHVVESTLEQIARSILLLHICLDESLGLQEATRYYLEIFGNTLLRPATAKYLVKCCDHLENVTTKTINCPWLNLDKLKHKDRDSLGSIFKFWKRATCDGVPIVDYWDRRVRRALKTRYDYREGVFDWDFHMVLKAKGHINLTLQEYRFWRNTGIAYTWLEGEPARSNPTLLSNILPCGDGFLHYAYLGDITTGPFFSWALDEENVHSHKKLRATDMAEWEVMHMIHQIRTGEPLCDELVAAHRDQSIVNGTIITDLPDNDTEQEAWVITDILRNRKNSISWTSIPHTEIIYHPMKALESFKDKLDYTKRFDVIWVSCSMKSQIPSLVPLLNIGAPMLIESCKYLVDFRKENHQDFTTEIKSIASENGLRDINNFNSENHAVARFLN